MCTVAEGFSTITGTREVLDQVEELWYRLDAVRAAHEFGPFEFQRPDLAILHPSLRDRRAPSVARVSHVTQPPSVMGRLQAELSIMRIPVFCEPGHEFTLCGGAPGRWPAQSPTVHIYPKAAARAAVGTLPRSTGGRRVAVLDTGDLGGHQPTMVDLVGGAMNPTAISDDVAGHGTAVASLITTINPAADIYPVRVVNAARAPSFEVYCGLAYALWCREFDVVNVSLSSQPAGGCQTVLGTSLDHILEICRQNNVPVPVLVAAAGNSNTGQTLGYPAVLPEAVVVQAWDWGGNPASYNINVNTVPTVYASGGEAHDSFGTITSAGGAVEQVFGTSFAAAVVTAKII